MTDETDREAFDRAFPKTAGDPLGFTNMPSPMDAFIAGRAERVQPTRDEIARVLSQAWSERIGEADSKGADSYHFTQADAILALFSSAPTVAQVRAEALREAAVEYASGRLTGVFMGRDDYTRAWLCARADALDPKEEN